MRLVGGGGVSAVAGGGASAVAGGGGGGGRYRQWLAAKSEYCVLCLFVPSTTRTSSKFQMSLETTGGDGGLNVTISDSGIPGMMGTF